MRNLEHYYRDEQKWSAGPHLFIADDLIWVLTPLTTSGRHSPSWNAISWGVEMVGEYQIEDFGDAVRDNTLAALTTLHALAGLDPNKLRFHKEDPITTHKTCPGRKVNKADIIARLNAAGVDHAPADLLRDAADQHLVRRGVRRLPLALSTARHCR